MTPFDWPVVALVWSNMTTSSSATFASEVDDGGAAGAADCTTSDDVSLSPSITITRIGWVEAS